MKEKTFKSMGFAGIVGIVTGIVIISIGIITGVLLVVTGGKLLNDRRDILI